MQTRSVSITPGTPARSEEHTSELQSRSDLVCRLLLEKKKHTTHDPIVKVVCLSDERPYPEERERHRAHAALARTGVATRLLQRGLELCRLRECSDRA